MQKLRFSKLKQKLSSMIMIMLLMFMTSAVPLSAGNMRVLAEEPQPEQTSETLPETAADETEDNNVATTTTEVTVEENAGVENLVEFGLNTGNNEIGNNTVVTGLETGDVDGTVNLLNLGNSELGEGSSFASQNILGGSNDITLFDAPSANRIDISSNRNTGSSSDNTNILENNNVVHVFEQTATSSDNIIDIIADTGTNTISNNTKIDSILTGDINLGVNLINLLDLIAPELQLTIDVWNILGDFTGDIKVTNDQTGAGSHNNNQIYGAGKVNVESAQTSDLDNYFTTQMNTGENEYGTNTLVGDVTTGNATDKNNLVNLSQIATPMLYLLNIFGEWDGNYGGLDPNYVIINVINSTTGPSADNINVIDGQGELDIESTSNTTANNNININANTGRNLISRNTIVGNIQTGNINVAKNVINILNSIDSSLNKFKLGIINIFGSWKHGSNNGGGGGNTDPGTPTDPGDADGGGGATSTPDSSVLGVTRTSDPSVNLETLPEAGGYMPKTTDAFANTVNHGDNNATRAPIWGLIALINFCLLLPLVGLKLRVYAK